MLELSDRDSKAAISKMFKAMTSSLTTNEKVQSLKKRKVKPENQVEIIELKNRFENWLNRLSDRVDMIETGTREFEDWSVELSQYERQWVSTVWKTSLWQEQNS